MSDPPLPEVVRDAVARAIGRPASDDEITLRPPNAHQSNRLYDVQVQDQHLIAKEYLRADLPFAARHEYDALRRLEALHLAPAPLYFDPSVGPVVLYRYMEGEMWDRRVPSAAELGALADLWLQFHCLGTDGFWLATGQARSWAEIQARLWAPLRSYAAWADHTSPRLRDAARLCLEALDRSLATARRLMPGQTPLCFCRSDARFANVIARTDGRLGLVDWEDSGLRDPAREVADLLMHPNQEDLLDWDAWQAFLSIRVIAETMIVGSRAGCKGVWRCSPCSGSASCSMTACSAWLVADSTPGASTKWSPTPASGATWRAPRHGPPSIQPWR